MRIDQLATFCCVADERSYTRAAERMSITQPAAYQQVRQLECELREKLFHVVGKTVLLTPAGRALYRFAASVEQARLSLTQELGRLRDEGRSVIRIGAAAYFGILPIAAERVAARFPGTVVEFLSMHPAETVQKIQAGEVDFGCFGPAFAVGELMTEHLLTQRIILIAPAGHELAMRRTVDVAELAAYPIVGFLQGSARCAIDAWLGDRPAVQLRYAALGDTSATIKAMALSSQVPAFVAEGAVREELRSGRLVKLTLRDFAVSYELNVVHRDRAALSPAARFYLDELLSLGRGRSPGRAVTSLAT